jgi:hypothetical protein
MQGEIAMDPKTKSVLTDETAFKPDTETVEGWNSLLNETLDFIHEEGQSGTLTAHFRPGGVMTALVFKETTTIPQAQRMLLSDNSQVE